MPSATPTPRRLPGQPPEDPRPADDRRLAADPWLDEPPGPPPWPDGDASGPSPWLDEDPGPGDPGDVIAWLDAELAKAAPWLADDPGWDDLAPPAPPAAAEVFKAGWWDRTRGAGGGFAAGGAADHLPPGPVLAGLAADRWHDGLHRLSDDELIGVLRAARRLASWATAMELAAVGDLWRRRSGEEDAGDAGAAVHADAELAAALTLTRHAADQLLGLAAAVGRLPATRTALAAGDIDPPRAKVIAEEVTGLTDQHAAAVEAAIIAAAPGQTTGQLRAATRRAVQSADPTAARRRKEQALHEARVERWTEPAGTAALAGRDLPPAAVLAADANLTALAKQLKAAGTDGTLDTLRAQIYLTLLTGAPVSSLLPTSPGETCPPSTSPADTSDPVSDDPSALRVTGRINLTLPLTTWLGQSDTPGHVAGYGPLDAADTRTLADVLAAHPITRWCLTLTGPDGRPLAHGCAHSKPAAAPRDGPAAKTSVRPATGTRDGPTTGMPGQPVTGTPRRRRTGSRERPGTRARPYERPGTRARPYERPGTRARPQPWTFTLTPLSGGDCDHGWETPAYRPTGALRHLVNLRHATCVFPGCRRPAAQCDADHSLAYEHGGRTCLCNLAPLCRHHHQVKQAPPAGPSNKPAPAPSPGPHPPDAATPSAQPAISRRSQVR